MKISQYLEKGSVRLGIVEKDYLQPIDFNGDMIDFIRKGNTIRDHGPAVHISELEMAPAVSRPSKIIALGLNYTDHAREGKADIPKVPLIFTKFQNSLLGSGGLITWKNSITKKVDFEAELAVIIGEKVYDCPEENALGAVFGFTCANDVSARDLQFGDGQWVRGKSLNTFCPLGPWIVTMDEIADPYALNIESRLNGQIMQKSNTGNLIFSVSYLVSFLSRHFTLFPGDIILTGTPSGVGVFRDPPVYLKNGDEIVIAIEGIGELVNRCRVIPEQQ